jgi:NAD(P)-dependent dehydrogenase (short-subunit alcohol dehydrogenase family)
LIRLVRLSGESTFVVFNNSGQIVVGEVDARKPFDVNFWGAANITKEAVRFFRDVNSPAGRRLLQVSSLVGIVGRPVVGFYSASYVIFVLFLGGEINLTLDNTDLQQVR